MKRLLNTLCVTTEGAYLRKDGETVAVEIDGVTRTRLPAHLLDRIVMSGETAISPGLITHAAGTGLSVAWLTWSGKLAGRLEGPQTGNVLLRQAQHRMTDDPVAAVPVARAVVAAKVANQRALLRRHLRDHGDAPGADAVEAAQRRLADAARHALTGPDLDILRGLEGEAAHAYWSIFSHLIRDDDPAFAFSGRNRHPPRDPVNAVLSFLYALAALDDRAACETNGLDPQIGFLHRDRPGRMSLALDLMEEVRAPLCDRVTLSLINRRQLRPHHLERQETGAVLLTDEGRKLVLTEWQARKRTELRHPRLDERLPLGLVLQVQAQLLARYLRRDVSDYLGWLWG